jgi:pectate lyase
MRSCLRSSPDRELSHFFMFITTHPLAVLAIIAGLLAPLFAPSLTFAVLPSNEQWREGLINQHVGYGTVTGGQGTTLCEVTNLNDSGAGSLRACAHFQSNRWIVFRVNGTINLTSETVNPGSNVTIDGRGVDITISGRAFWVADVSNVIFENLKFDNMTGDGNLDRSRHNRPKFRR